MKFYLPSSHFVTLIVVLNICVLYLSMIDRDIGKSNDLWLFLLKEIKGLVEGSRCSFKDMATIFSFFWSQKFALIFAAFIHFSMILFSTYWLLNSRRFNLVSQSHSYIASFATSISVTYSNSMIESAIVN